MQRLKNSGVCLLSRVGKVFGIPVVLLLSIAAAAFGQGPVLTLAMISYDQSPIRAVAAPGRDQARDTLQSTSIPLFQFRKSAGELGFQDITDLSFTSPLESQTAVYRFDRLQLIGKKVDEDGWAGSRVQIIAGYGQFCQLESGFGKSTMELEQPSCIYLKARFSF